MASSDAPLGPPPRKASFRRPVRQMRRAYRFLFALIILILGGWALLDAYRWPELSTDQRALTVGFAVCSLVAFLILKLVEDPLARELRLARFGYVAQGQILAIEPARRRRRRVIVSYTFRTVAGATIEGRCILAKRAVPPTLQPGATVEVLYDPARPRVNKPRVLLDYVEFLHI